MVHQITNTAVVYYVFTVFSFELIYCLLINSLLLFKMPTICAVFGCVNKTLDKSLSFYRFPKVKVNAASDLRTQILKQRTHYTELMFMIVSWRTWGFVQFFLNLVNILLEINNSYLVAVLVLSLTNILPIHLQTTINNHTCTTETDL